jgi:hypothetical protein
MRSPPTAASVSAPAQGNLPAALASYQASLAIRDHLVNTDPGNAGWQRDLSVSYAKLAYVYRKSEQAANAREALAAGRAIMARLVEQFPDQVQWKRDLVWFDRAISAE